VREDENDRVEKTSGCGKVKVREWGGGLRIEEEE